DILTRVATHRTSLHKRTSRQHSHLSFLLSLPLPPPTPTLFPYTTLFRSQLVPGAVPAGARRSAGRGATDKRHAPPRDQPGTRPAARAVARRERQGPRRERHDRRPAAQRPLARVPPGERARARAVRAGALRHRAPSRLHGRR